MKKLLFKETSERIVTFLAFTGKRENFIVSRIPHIGC